MKKIVIIFLFLLICVFVKIGYDEVFCNKKEANSNLIDKNKTLNNYHLDKIIKYILKAF